MRLRITQQYTVTFDALLVGHEAAVTSLSWRTLSPQFPTPTLLSTSTDSSLILWSPSTTLSPSQDEATSIWINRHRFGDVGGQRFGGFVGGLWSEKGDQVFSWGWSGGWRRWACTDDTDQTWEEYGAISGHKGPVKDISWSPNGDYLISTGCVLMSSWRLLS